MVEALEWIGREAAHGGVVEREFRLSRTAGTVPGMLWLPSAARAEPSSGPARARRQRP